jgi:hypothetical protein
MIAFGGEFFLDMRAYKIEYSQMGIYSYAFFEIKT